MSELCPKVTHFICEMQPLGGTDATECMYNEILQVLRSMIVVLGCIRATVDVVDGVLWP